MKGIRPDFLEQKTLKEEVIQEADKQISFT